MGNLEQVPSDRLSTLRAHAEAAHGVDLLVSIDPKALLALVEGAAAMQEVRDSIDYDLTCRCNQCQAMGKVLAAVAKLEAL